MKKYFLLVLALSGGLISCQNAPEEVDHHAEMLAKTDSLQSLIDEEGVMSMNVELGEAAMNAYADFAKAFPEDSLSPIYAYRAGSIALNVPQKEYYAVDYFVSVYQDYPEHPLAAQALFMTGVSFDQAQDKERASKTFKHFLEVFPEHPWASEAQAMLILNSDTVDLESQVESWLQTEE